MNVAAGSISGPAADVTWYFVWHLSLNHEIQPQTGVDIALAFTSSSPWFNIFPGWTTANENMILNLGILSTL